MAKLFAFSPYSIATIKKYPHYMFLKAVMGNFG